MVRAMTKLTGSMALAVSLPVDVFPKSAPAIAARGWLALSVPNSPVAKIGFHMRRATRFTETPALRHIMLANCPAATAGA